MRLNFSIEKNDLIKAKATLVNRHKMDFKDIHKCIIKNTIIMVLLIILIYMVSMYICFNDKLDYLISLPIFYITTIILIVVAILGSLIPLVTSKLIYKTWAYKLFKFDKTLLFKMFTISIENNNYRITTPLVIGNIRERDNTLFLFDDDKFLIIIPLSKVNDKDSLLNTINQHIEVIRLWLINLIMIRILLNL